MPLEAPERTLHAGPSLPGSEPKPIDFALPAAPVSSSPARGDDGASMALYAHAMQSRLGRAAASPDVVALVERRANLVLQIVVDVDGTVRDARVVEGEPDPALRNAALRIERSAEPFPPLPPEIRASGPVAFRVPLRFVLRRR